MRLRSEADVQEFLDAVSQCGGDVYLKSPEGDIFNLKSSMSRYIAIGRLIEEQGDTPGALCRPEGRPGPAHAPGGRPDEERGLSPRKKRPPREIGAGAFHSVGHLSKDGFTK